MHKSLIDIIQSVLLNGTKEEKEYIINKYGIEYYHISDERVDFKIKTEKGWEL